MLKRCLALIALACALGLTISPAHATVVLGSCVAQSSPGFGGSSDGSGCLGEFLLSTPTSALLELQPGPDFSGTLQITLYEGVSGYIGSVRQTFFQGRLVPTQASDVLGREPVQLPADDYRFTVASFGSVGREGPCIGVPIPGFGCIVYPRPFTYASGHFGGSVTATDP
jgi:hypothetical protein